MAIIAKKREYDNTKQLSVFATKPMGFVSLSITKEQLLEQYPEVADTDFLLTNPREASNGHLLLTVLLAGAFIGNYFPAQGVTLEEIKAAKVSGELHFGINSTGRKATTKELAEAF